MKQEGLGLVFHLGALGDFLLALPALALIFDERGPEVWGPSPARLRVALAPRGPIQAVRTLPHQLFAAQGTDPALDDRLETFSRVVAFVRDDESPLAARVRALGGAVIPPFPLTQFSETTVHVADFLIAEARRRGLVVRDGPAYAVLQPTSGDREEAGKILARAGVVGAPIVVHAGAGGRSKRWAPERFAVAAREIQTRLAARGEHHEVVSLLGPAELDGPPDPALRLGGVACATLEDPPLETLLGVLASARLFLGNDGGVTHLAAAAGTPLVALFGPSYARVWGPRGRSPLAILEAPGKDLDRLEPEAVIAAALDVLHRAGDSGNQNHTLP